MESGREYYVLTAQNGNPIPRVVNWYGKLDVRKLNRKDYRELPAHILLDMGCSLPGYTDGSGIAGV